MPFRDPDRTHGLGTRIELEVRERLEEAVDYVCLEALVQGRRSRGLPAPVADNAADRREYTQHVQTFLQQLERELTAGLDADQRRRVDTTSAAPNEEARLMRVQVALARLLPDYWQRFDAARARYLAEPAGESGSGSEGGGLLARLFRRG
ncbi:MAG: hypothetical protein DMD78_13140 [Candidatus Rokuibacteriota bacterium]|nr:MAG: hypothetical protein DMD78_13140 [Candidatus Rokubacteria bacterium]